MGLSVRFPQKTCVDALVDYEETTIQKPRRKMLPISL